MKDLVIIGVGFPDIIQTIEDINSEKKKYNVLGFLDDNPNLHGTEVLSYPILGSIDWLIGQKNVWVINTLARDLKVREKINNRLKKISNNFATLVHPSVNTKYTDMAENLLISKNVYIEPRSKIMAGTMILPNSTIGHDVVINKNCFIASGCHLGGFVTLGKNCLIGAGSSLHPSITIGNGCKIGINSSICLDLKYNSTVFSKPMLSLN